MIFSDGQQCAFRQNQATFWLETFGLETFGLETFGQETSGRVPFWGPAWQSSSLDFGPDFSTELCVEVLSEATLKPWPLDLVLGSSCGSAVVPDFSSVQEERWRRGDGHGYGYGLLRAYLATWLLPHGWSTATLYGQPCGWWSLSGPRCQTTPWTPLESSYPRPSRYPFRTNRPNRRLVNEKDGGPRHWLGKRKEARYWMLNGAH